MKKITPPNVPDHGGTVVTVQGLNCTLLIFVMMTLTSTLVVNSSRLACKFGTLAPIAASYYNSSTQFECITRPHIPEPVFLEVANNFVNFTANKEILQYLRMIAHIVMVHSPCQRMQMSPQFFRLLDQLGGIHV